MQTNYFKTLIVLLIPLFFGCSSNVASKAGATPEYDRIEIEQLLISN